MSNSAEDAVRQALFAIVRQHGAAIYSDPRRCDALLKDLGGPHPREIRILVEAVREGIPVQLVAAMKSGEPIVMVISRLVQHLDDLGNKPEIARWSVNLWAAALSGLQQQPQPQSQPSQPASPRLLKPVCELRVGKLHNFRTISAALRVAQPGNRIVVEPGLYKESLRISSAVEIIGGDGVVVESVDGACISSYTDGAVVVGLRLQNSVPGFSAVEISAGDIRIEDCVILSSACASVFVRGALANPLLRRCRICDGMQEGLYFKDGANGCIEDCDVYNNRFSNVRLSDAGDPVFKRCSIRDGAGVGVWTGGRGKANFDYCQIYGNECAGVWVHSGSDPRFHFCNIRNGKAGGIWFRAGSSGLLEDCDIFGNTTNNVDINGRSNPLFRRCLIRQSGEFGVHVSEHGGGIFEDCEIQRNVSAGVALRSGATSDFRRCKIGNGNGQGVTAANRAKGSFIDCEISGNMKSNLVVSSDSVTKFEKSVRGAYS